MKQKWELNDNTLIEARFGFKKKVSINGKEIYNRFHFNFGKKDKISFTLPNGQSATISLRFELMQARQIDLRIDGQLMRPSTKTPIKCVKCSHIVKPNDQFCEKCGHPIPSFEVDRHQKRIKSASKTLIFLSILFAISGIFFFLAQQQESQKFLAQLAMMNPSDTFPEQIEGKTYTVAALIKQIEWEILSVLVINFILAGSMFGLALWSKRSPLAALLIASAIYAVVIVSNAIIDPKTLVQGLLWKFIIVGLLINGIKSALLLRIETNE